MKTLKGFFDDSAYPEFYRKVWNMGGVSWSDFKECPGNYQDAGSGSVPGCIYYVDTVKFGKRNHLQILQMIG